MSGYSVGWLAPFGLMFSTIAALVLIAAWVILATSRFVQGGVVEALAVVAPPCQCASSVIPQTELFHL